MVNSSTSVWQRVAVTNTGGSWSTGSVFVPKTPESYTYDSDGNLTQDGRWDYTWDGENRLVKMESRTTGQPTGSKLRLEFAYDDKGRRVWKKVTSLDTSTVLSENKFVYDGWNLVATLDASAVMVQAYVWGTDLSGSLQGAGGVGGLLWIVELSGGSAVNAHFAACDGNGNVSGLVRASDATETARYDYGPFGESIRHTGSYAKANPFRFSTKFTDNETGMLYYGYRSYNPSTGRWLSRDPIDDPSLRAAEVKEKSFQTVMARECNDYSVVNNSTIGSYDYLGLEAGETDVSVTFKRCESALTDAEKLQLLFDLGKAANVFDQIIAGNKPLPSVLTMDYAKCIRNKLRGFAFVCRSSCDPVCWTGDAGAFPYGSSVNFCASRYRDKKTGKINAQELSETVIHELTHSCGKIGHTSPNDPTDWELFISHGDIPPRKSK